MRICLLSVLLLPLSVQAEPPPSQAPATRPIRERLAEPETHLYSLAKQVNFIEVRTAALATLNQLRQVSEENIEDAWVTAAAVTAADGRAGLTIFFIQHSPTVTHFDVKAVDGQTTRLAVDEDYRNDWSATAWTTVAFLYQTQFDLNRITDGVGEDNLLIMVRPVTERHTGDWVYAFGPIDRSEFLRRSGVKDGED